MRTNAAIDDTLMEQALQSGGLQTKKTAIEEACAFWCRRIARSACAKSMARFPGREIWRR
jgi:Arc/MetJ family transcription regulator